MIKIYLVLLLIIINSLTLDNTLAHYLNHDFYDTLDKTYILESTWYTGEYSSSNDYDYMSVYNDSVIAHVGLLKN